MVCDKVGPQENQALEVNITVLWGETVHAGTKAHVPEEHLSKDLVWARQAVTGRQLQGEIIPESIKITVTVSNVPVIT